MKIWYLQINGKREGPLSFEELREDIRLTPDSLVWREGFAEWKRIRDVLELKDLFKDPVTPTPDDESLIDFTPCASSEDELVLDFRQEQPPYFFWLFATLLVILYVIYELFLR